MSRLEHSFLASARSISIDSVKLTSFAVQGNLASATTAQLVSYMMLDPTDYVGKPGGVHRVVTHSTIEYSLIWLKGGWKIQSVTQGAQPFTIDGRVGAGYPRSN